MNADFALQLSDFRSSTVTVRVTSAAAFKFTDGAISLNVYKSQLPGWVSRMRDQGFAVDLSCDPYQAARVAAQEV